MKCLICKKIYFERRTLLTLFHEPVTVRCHSCQEKYHIIPHETVYPITNYLLYMTTLFLEKNDLSEDAFMLEMRAILIDYIEKSLKNAMILFVDELSEGLYLCLDQLNLSDILLISLYPPSFLV